MLVLLIMLLMSILGISLLRMAEINALETAHALNRTRAFWLAEAGVEEFKAVLAKPKNRTRLDWVGASPGLIGTGIIKSTLPGGGRYSVDIIEDAANSTSRIKTYTVTSTGTSLGGEQSRVSLRAKTETFGGYTYASHIEGNIWFYGGDKIGEEDANNGIFYSNDQIKITGKPKIWATAQSAADKVDYNDLRNEKVGDPDVFKNGLTLNAEALDFGDQNFEQIQRLIRGGKRLSGDYTLEFNDDEYYLTDKADKSGIITTNSIAGINNSVNKRILYFEGSVAIKGNVGMQVSVAAEGSIYIVDDIVYTSSIGQGHHTGWKDRGYKPAADEVLGLFTQERVQIAEGWNIGTVDIHATILVTNPGDALLKFDTFGGFGAAKKDNTHTKDYGQIYLYGSLSQYKRATVGYINGTGYSKKYSYDDRLTLNPPPGTPYSSFELSEWRRL